MKSLFYIIGVSILVIALTIGLKFSNLQTKTAVTQQPLDTSTPIQIAATQSDKAWKYLLHLLLA